MTQKVPFQTVVEALLDDGTPFPARFLHQFSDIAPTDLVLLLKAWPQIKTRRKNTLLEDLEELAEADTLTNFDEMARPLLADDDPQVRIRAIRLLWESEDIKLVPIFLKMLNEDVDPEVRAAAANALGLFATRVSWRRSPQTSIIRSKMTFSKRPLPPKRSWCAGARWSHWDIPDARK
jgi:hypothetical protein